MSAELLLLFLKGVGIGLLLAVPVGPISLLCLRRSLTLGIGAGLVTGAGVATADALYAAIATFALGAAAPLIAEASWLGMLGGLVLIALGLRDVLHRDTAPAPPTLAGHMGAYAGAVLLTLANPATVLTFAAIIIGLDLVPGLASPTQGAIFVGGVFAGSALWWIVLSVVGGRLGNRLPRGAIRWIRRAAGAAFIGFGVYAILG
ncbi:MAG: LysE family transporter [Rhodospirillales bacterium]|nr:MAG: LysE family transporter [Rhodospirillales bacterium]